MPSADTQYKAINPRLMEILWHNLSFAAMLNCGLCLSMTRENVQDQTSPERNLDAQTIDDFPSTRDRPGNIGRP